MINATDSVHPVPTHKISAGFNGEKGTISPIGNDFKGITLRTELAARAMQAQISRFGVDYITDKTLTSCVQLADALIAELNKTETNG